MERRLKNVTVTLDEETARWARLEAARQDTSVSRLLGNLLRERMVAEDTYEVARTRYFAQEARVHRAAGQCLPSREEVHDRAGLR
ncbi:MAG: hypothetical protein WEA34_04015 [Gemmatimonadota bacterium]